MGMAFTLEFVVAEFRPPLAVVVVGRGPGGLTCRFVFDAKRADGGRSTILSLAGEFETPMMKDNAELEKVLIDSCTRQLTISLERLQAVAESRAVSRSAS